MTESLRGLATVKGQQFVIVTAIFFLLILAVAGLRVWAKIVVGRRFEIHDYLAFAALICTTGFAVVSILCVYPGTVGMHLPDAASLGSSVMRTTLKIFYSAGFIWITSTILIKLSLLHFYRSIFLVHSVRSQRIKLLQYSAYTIYALCVLYWIAHITLLLRICQPITLQWDPAQGSGHCGDITKEEISSSAMNMILDLSIVILPMPSLWSLRISLKKKFAINAILSLGLLVCIISAVRLILVIRNGSEDFTYTSTDVGIFSGSEIYIGWISTSLPTLGPLFRKDRLATEARNRKYYVSRRGERSGKPLKKGFRDSLLMMNQSFQPLKDQDISWGGSGLSNKQQAISRTQEIHVTVDTV
ncbi:hypothetical protein GJ744_011318 [Endocarpon pusillum]|uniref:Rhodopsin domain-containing protein n=1 Tax=Endocarpon pusillum TaxID=364733 RepID=A0A8H7AU88_9EURO|nr:hypothetical protein GJ744_011318 [Endocarpon pusillum]